MWRLLICAIALLLGSACSNSDSTSEVVSEAQVMPATGAAATSEAMTTYGVTDFEATGSPAAYPTFLTGLLQLHNFEFEDARESFIEAQAMDPDFYMAYWGEALSHKQPLWNREDLPAGRAALAKLAPTAEERLELAPTERERAYMAAAHRLFSEEGTELEIETDYAEMLGEIYERWPDDLDAGALYALGILTTSHNGREFDKYMRAGAITEEILDINPLHPGALHYNIHSFDDPIHAPLGLRSARVYSDVAPDAVHALHMPSHIFLALGDFEGTRDLNRRSYDASVARSETHDGVLFRNESYHAHSWLLYSHIQLHEFDEARGMIEYVASQIADGDDMAHGQMIMGRAFLALETGNWDDPALAVEVDLARVSPMHRATEHYIRARQALEQNDLESMERHVNEIVVPENSGPAARDAVPSVLKSVGQGQLLIARGNTGEGLALLKAAAELEHSLPPFIGPPVIVQPAGEAAGDALRAMGDNAEAVRYYNMTLERAVNKTRSRMAVDAIRADAQQGSESGVDFLGIYAPPVFDGGGPPRRRPDVLPLSDEGRQAVEDYDPILDNPRIQDDCAPESMPRLLWTGNPMELREGEGDTLIIHYERGNTIRTIHMSGAAAPGDQANSYLGYSVGRWEGDILTIDTTHMLGLHLSGGAEPLSLQTRVTERYWREPGSMDLQLELEIDDPGFYTEVFTMGREYIWAPEEALREWVCVDFGDSTAPPDIDEMIRMLEEL